MSLTEALPSVVAFYDVRLSSSTNFNADMARRPRTIRQRPTGDHRSGPSTDAERSALFILEAFDQIDDPAHLRTWSLDEQPSAILREQVPDVREDTNAGGVDEGQPSQIEQDDLPLRDIADLLRQPIRAHEVKLAAELDGAAFVGSHNLERLLCAHRLFIACSDPAWKVWPEVVTRL